MKWRGGKHHDPELITR